MYYTYVLQSTKDKNFYTGFTKDLKLRFDQHKKGLVESTKNRRPVMLIYYEASLSKEDAIRRERYFKTYNGKIFLKRRRSRRLFRMLMIKLLILQKFMKKRVKESYKIYFFLQEGLLR